MNFDELYQELILDHSRRPRNNGEIEGEGIIHVHGDNPSCGDEINLHVRFGPEKVEEIRFTGHGCAISQASASMMTLKLKGKKHDEAAHLLRLFHDRVAPEASSSSEDDPGPMELGDLNVLGGVRKFPQRVKCAMLAWRAFEQALQEREAGTEGASPESQRRVSTEEAD